MIPISKYFYMNNDISESLIGRSTLRKKYPYSEFFWSAFPRIRTEYGEIFHISSYSVRLWENMDQENSEYGQFSRSAK